MIKKLITIAVCLLICIGSVFVMAIPLDSQGRQTPWDSQSIKITVAETFSEFDNGAIQPDQEPFWTGAASSEWPELAWKKGVLVFTNAPIPSEESPTRFSFRIQTDEMNESSAKGSTGIGFYIENNTANPQNIGFYMIGAASCLKSANGTPLYFITTNGQYVISTVGESEMAIIPPGTKGYVMAFYEDMQNLWADGQTYDGADPIKMPGFELVNLKIDKSKGESVVIDNVFFFGPGCTGDTEGAITVNRTLTPYGGTTAPPTTSAPTTTNHDVDNHIDCENSGYKIPKGTPVRLDESKGWKRTEQNLITNFYSMYQPEVVYVPEWDTPGGYPYIMWFFAWSYNQENDPQGNYPGYPGGDAIFCARAQELEGPWEVYSQNYSTGAFFWDEKQNPYLWYPVITCQDKWYDSWHVGDPSVVYKDGMFYMAYSAMGADVDGIPSHKQGDTDGNTGCIMGATSTDGIHWTLSDAPLIMWEGEKGFNETSYPPEYIGGHQRPSIMFEDGKWKMWYDYRTNQVGYAECTGDFMKGADWKELRSGNSPLLSSVDFDVIKIGDIYYAYADPYVSWAGVQDSDIPSYSDDASQWSQRQIVEYQSYDGLNWTPTGYFLPDTGYGANQIPQVFLDHKNGRVCIMYATQRGKKFSSTYDWRWDNIRVMSRDIALFAQDINDINITPAPTLPPDVTQDPNATEAATTTEPTPNSIWPIVLIVTVGIAAIIAITLVIIKKRKAQRS